ncbi:M14 family metallopeptidase [Sphingosinicella rhizophila]|uniref:M14 family metallopeptidase n=1 Tax=Sphingosinicella rhizophila TaxID=3050082 RepID=A0ABU3Q2N6_9SPHN|nr:M14 family metallopeptidase [Sphingosinicella sp. GR2756]MDT9597669.1 M14 family metallopeptidase [Sphingosinicella sp. GR2756]
MMRRTWLRGVAALALAFSAPASIGAPQISPPNDIGVTAPASAFRQEPGSDYFLANYTEYETYLKRLAGESDRIKLVDIGKSSEGRTQWMAIVSSPANLARLDTYRDIARRLAKAEGLDDEQAHALAQQGKAVVWIDAGMHATETVTTQSQIHVLYRLLTGNDAETLRILDDVIILFGHANPDGLQLVADWYMRKTDPEKREFGSIPRLYQKYVGHDNNRDYFTSHMAETTNINRVLFRQWFPQIVFNQHQTGPAGTVVFAPPFRDPFNFNYDPLVMSQLSEVGAAMHSRLIAEGKPGSTMRSGAPYSTWHNGMERSIAYFHNSIGLLTEIIGGPTPERIPLVPDTQLPRNDEPMPVAPGPWHLRDSLEYQWSLNRAVLDYASRNRERLLFNIYRMGSNNIARGSRDHWTVTPRRIDALKEAAGDAPPPAEDGIGARAENRVATGLYDKVLRDPALRDPRGYVVPAGQADMPTVTAFLNSLIKNGIDVEKADEAFSLGGAKYPVGSFVVKAAQAYRSHVIDMFEPQDHPHDLEYPGGPPTPPYDIAGYTLAYQMGIAFDRIMEAMDGPFVRVPDLLSPEPGRIIGEGRAGWLIPHDANQSFTLTNRLLAAGIGVSWLKTSSRAGGRRLKPGAIWVPRSARALEILEEGTAGLGINAYGLPTTPLGELLALMPPRIGLVDQYGGVMQADWTQWLLEQHEFPFRRVFPQELDAGGLGEKYDVLVFADDTIPFDKDSLYHPGRSSPQPEARDIPADLRSRLGLITTERTVPQIAAFARAGGTVITIGSANRLAELIGAPAKAALAKEGKPLPRTSFFIPGSLVSARVDNGQPLAYGMPERVDMFFANSQSFQATGSGAVPISWYDQENPLRSGWALGQDKLKGTIAIVDADIGKGKVFMMGPEVTQRAQPYATFKFLFNGLLYGPAVTAE